MELELLQIIDLDKQHHLWYGGDVATIKHEDVTFVISANGDVRGSIIDKNGVVTSRFKDKRKQGVLRDYLLESGITNDKDLKDKINYDYEKQDSVNLMDSNWWELYAIHNGEHIDLDLCLGSEKILGAIDEVISIIPQQKEYILTMN